METTSKLKASWQTPEQAFEVQKITFERSQRHWEDIQSSFPELQVQCTLSMSDLGRTCLRAFIECPEGISDRDTRTAIQWLNRKMGKAERGLRKETGKFYWSAKQELTDEHGKYDFLIFIENTHQLTCEVVKVKKEVEVYESICK